MDGKEERERGGLGAIFWMESFFCKVEFVYIQNTPGLIERIRTPRYSRLMIANLRVKLLSEREDVSPNLPDTGGRTPLSLASQKRHKRVVELLQVHHVENGTARHTFLILPLL